MRDSADAERLAETQMQEYDEAERERLHARKIRAPVMLVRSTTWSRMRRPRNTQFVEEDESDHSTSSEDERLGASAAYDRQRSRTS